MFQLSSTAVVDLASHRAIKYNSRCLATVQIFIFFCLVSQKAFATVVTAAEKMDANSITSEGRNEIIQYPLKTISTVSTSICYMFIISPDLH